jgi:hypothetical protein
VRAKDQVRRGRCKSLKYVISIEDSAKAVTVKNEAMNGETKPHGLSKPNKSRTETFPILINSEDQTDPKH